MLLQWCVCLCVLLSLRSVTGQDYYLSLNGDRFENNSLIRMENIGEGSKGLHCVTSHRPCCRGTTEGEWFFPNGEQLPVRAFNDDFYRNRNDEGSVIFNRRNGPLGPHGLYKCILPQHSGRGNVEIVARIYSFLAFPTIRQQPTSLSNLVPGSKATFSVSAIDARSYRWLHNGGTIHSSDRYLGTQTSTLQILGVRESDEGSYVCVVWNELSLRSEEATLTLLDLPTITEQPLNLLNFIPGQDATFTVVATGINVRYEWQYSNGSTLELKPNYEGVTSATLTVSAVTRKDAGSYRCAVINPAGTVYTEHVRIMLLEPPLIEVQPEHVSSISPGEDVSLSLLASGFYLIYQWKYADGSRLGSGFEGVNTSTLTIQDVEESGSYQCAVSNPAGTVLSYITNVTIAAVLPVMSINATTFITSVNISWVPSSKTNVTFQISYYHLAFPDSVTVVEVTEPHYTAVGLLPRGRYRFTVRQVKKSGTSGAVSIDITLSGDIPPVESVDIEMLNSSTIAVTWEPPSPLPGWNISYYLIEITSLTTHAPSRTYMERTATGNEASIVIMDGDLFVGDGVELVTEVRAVLDVGVDGVGMLEGESAVRRKTLEPENTAFQIILGPIDYCITWTDEKTSEIRRDIQAELVKVVSESCQCNFTSQSISPGLFSCRQSTDSVVYRSSIIGINSEFLVSMINLWVKTEQAVMLIRSFFVDVYHYKDCPVQLESIMDPECDSIESKSSFPQTLLTNDAEVIKCVSKCVSEATTLPFCEPNP